jgi:DNA (cytosine-5)-methyltransferase 1
MEAASVAWEPLGFEPVGFSEIEKFPSEILKHRFPNVPNYGDLTKHAQWPIQPGSIDILVGGTPCQSFSVAGLRKGLEDPRGNLSLVFLGLADRLRPRWIVWENVPGFLSADGGRCASAFFGSLAELGYGWAYRVCDAQYFGVAQRRRRVFVVAYLGDPSVAGKVLFESQGLRGDSQESQQKGQEDTRTSENCAGGEGQALAFGRNKQRGPIRTTGCLTSHHSHRDDFETDTFIVYRKSRRAQSNQHPETWVEADKSNTLNTFDIGEGRETHAVVNNPIVIDRASFNQGKNGMFRFIIEHSNVMATIMARGPHAISFQPGNLRREAGAKPGEVVTTLKATNGDQTPHVATSKPLCVRRLTPIETERLQGFPDNWSQIPWKGKPAEECPDGLRYKACGNSMAVPVMSWIGKRIKQVDQDEKNSSQKKD